MSDTYGILKEYLQQPPTTVVPIDRGPWRIELGVRRVGTSHSRRDGTCTLFHLVSMDDPHVPVLWLGSAIELVGQPPPPGWRIPPQLTGTPPANIGELLGKHGRRRHLRDRRGSGAPRLVDVWSEVRTKRGLQAALGECRGFIRQQSAEGDEALAASEIDVSSTAFAPAMAGEGYSRQATGQEN